MGIHSKSIVAVKFQRTGRRIFKPFLSAVPTHSVFLIKSAKDCKGGVISAVFFASCKNGGTTNKYNKALFHLNNFLE
jgi:hypothetical protein